MSHHARGCLINSEPDTIVLHHGTNDLSTKSSPDDIVKNIITLATSTKTSTNNVFVSGITKINDKWNDKGRKVILLSKAHCKSANIPYIDNNNVTKTMLNYSYLYLNAASTTALVNNICKTSCD